MFCSIDKQTAKVKEIGLTGVNPKYNASGTFDYKTGKLYWTTCERTTDQSGLYEIDPQTGAASFITSYPNNEMVSCLYIPQEANNFKLGEIAGFTADFSNTATTTGSVSITAPSKDAAGNTITGEVTVLLMPTVRSTSLSRALPAQPSPRTLHSTRAHTCSRQ